MQKMELLTRSAAACAVALVIAGCGGGGSSSGYVSGTAAPASSAAGLQLSGTAATGAALVDASVSVKCASGSGTATTDANGAYTLKLNGGALPCVIKVTGTQGGVEVTLHSLTEAGSTDANGVTSASANATPLTEMIVAQLTAGLPEDFFSAFNAASGAQITSEKLAAATDLVFTVLKEQFHIDLAGIDPFKSTLVAATAAAPAGGNGYDQLLDQLGAQVDVQSLPQVVTTIASAAASGTSSDLGTAIASVATPVSLPGCPSATSGKYRTVDYFGRTTVRDVNFKTMKYNTGDGQPLYDITADPSKVCEFKVAGTANGETVEYSMVFGTGGMGSYKVQNFTTSRSSVGYLFPVQSHPVSALAGEWTYLQSGYVNSVTGFTHYAGKFDIQADGSITACDYVDGDYSACVPNTAARALTARGDGGFDLAKNGATVASLYGFRAPNGTLNIFATQNPTGANTADTLQTSMLLTQLKPLSLPADGAVTKYWDLQFSQNGSSATRVVTLSADSSTVTNVSGNVVTRTRASDARVDTVEYNQPATGMRYRPQGSTYAAVNQFLIPGANFTVSINSVPTSPPTQQQIYVISMNRP